MSRDIAAEAQRKREKRKGRNEERRVESPTQQTPVSSLSRVFFLCASTAFCLSVFILAAGCARKAAEPAAPEYPYSSAERRAFYATAAGLSERPGAEAPRTASYARHASVLSADGERILVAVNGAGPVFIEAAPEGTAAEGRAAGGGAAYRIVDAPRAEAFSRLTAGGVWPCAGGFLLQLYRDPFGAEGDEAAGDARGLDGAKVPHLFLVGPGGAAAPLEPFATLDDPSFELFALFPSQGRWFAELRAERADRAELRFFALGALGADETARGRASQLREIGRRDFETALRPRPIAELPAELRAALGEALAAMGERRAGGRMLRIRGAEGQDGWYLEGKRPEDAAPAFVWFQKAPASVVLVLLPDGTFARAGGGSPATVSTLEAPVAGASFTALAAVKGLAAAAWEAGEFPKVAAAGIVVADAASPSAPPRDIVKP